MNWPSTNRTDKKLDQENKFLFVAFWLAEDNQDIICDILFEGCLVLAFYGSCDIYLPNYDPSVLLNFTLWHNNHSSLWAEQESVGLQNSNNQITDFTRKFTNNEGIHPLHWKQWRMGHLPGPIELELLGQSFWNMEEGSDKRYQQSAANVVYLSERTPPPPKPQIPQINSLL